MSEETWEIVKSRRMEDIELQLALQCAPLIAGLKISNLLNIHRKNLTGLKRIMKNSGFWESSWLGFKKIENIGLLYFCRCRTGVITLVRFFNYRIRAVLLLCFA